MEEQEPTAFVTHTLKGVRFEGHAVPVTVLPELSAYREIVVQVARALFYQDNPERRRVPNNFEEGFELVLRDIGDGSAVAPLERRRRKVAAAPEPPEQLSLPATGVTHAPEPDYFERARDLVSAMIEAMHAGTAPPPAFPAHVLRSFNKLGRSLRDDEAIEILSPGRTAAATYDRTVRKKLVLLREKTYEDSVDITGPVVQFDSQRQTFGLSMDGRTVTGSLDGLDAEQLRIVRTAAVHVEELRIRASGTGAFDSSERVVRLVEITDLSFAEDEDLRVRLDVGPRLAALAELQPGWLDGEGAALDPTALEWLLHRLTEAEEGGLPRPYLYPTFDGHVQAEWSFPGAEVSALFDFEGKLASCVGVHTKSGAQRDADVALDTAGGVAQLCAFVLSFAP